MAPFRPSRTPTCGGCERAFSPSAGGRPTRRRSPPSPARDGALPLPASCSSGSRPTSSTNCSSSRSSTLLARAGRGASLICIASFPGRPRFAGLGELGPEELVTLVGTEHDVDPSEFRLAQAVWAAYRSPDPTPIEAVLADDCSALPFVRGALVRHLEQFPSVENGLSRIEHDIVDLAADEPRTRIELFRAQSEREKRPFLGD
jgi:hypothetical protein